MSEKVQKRRRVGPALSKTEQRILGYLVQHPEACDSVEGILHWWITDQAILEDEVVVKGALKNLVEAGYLIGARTGDSLTHYSLNTHRLEEIRKLVGRQKDVSQS